jgi:hypothetical protein
MEVTIHRSSINPNWHNFFCQQYKSLSIHLELIYLIFAVELTSFKILMQTIIINNTSHNMTVFQIQHEGVHWQAYANSSRQPQDTRRLSEVTKTTREENGQWNSLHAPESLINLSKNSTPILLNWIHQDLDFSTEFFGTSWRDFVKFVKQHPSQCQEYNKGSHLKLNNLTYKNKVVHMQ